jgi:hypothetical protein
MSNLDETGLLMLPDKGRETKCVCNVESGIELRFREESDISQVAFVETGNLSDRRLPSLILATGDLRSTGETLEQLKDSFSTEKRPEDILTKTACLSTSHAAGFLIRQRFVSRSEILIFPLGGFWIITVLPIAKR